MLVGPLLGGFLVDAVGWEWIFFINVPVGIIGMILVIVNVPRLETHAHSFDIVGVVLSALGLFLIVFGIQEGGTYDWGRMPVAGTGATVPVPVVIGAGVVAMGAFLWWQKVTTREALVPLELFRDRNYVLSNAAISLMGFFAASSSIPLFLYVQSARGLTPSQSAYLMIPMAVASGVLAPFVGRFVQRRDARPVVAVGLLVLAASTAWNGLWMDPARSPWWLLLPSLATGIAASAVWGPLAMIATRNLPGTSPALDRGSTTPPGRSVP
ncbi:MFS transporter [Tessaracoccus coleopterorum]|uniref:MFS transporter n=1 Tax=Tessaracoccus coleopterorum TaxID=2714950 RepID=UPI0022B22114|nr:MFS transporter [Tessaracoccus coleopterorum]